MKQTTLIILLIGLLTNLAYAQDKETLDSLQKTYQNEQSDTSKILILVEIAFQYFSTHADTSIVLAKRALEQSRRLGFQRGATRSLNRIGVGYWAQGDYPKALHYFRESYRESELIGDWATCSSSLNNMGHTHYILKHYPQALEYFQKGVELSQKIGNQYSYATCMGNIGKINREQGNYEKAIEYIEKSLAISRKVKYKRWIAENLNELGLIYTHKKEYEKALHYYQEDLQICEQTGNELFLIHSLNGLAQLHQEMKKYDQSIAFGLRALEVAQKIHALRQIKDVSLTLSNTYKLKGEYLKALTYFELHKTSNDSIFNTENDKKMADIETRAAKAETEKKDLELTKAKELGVFQQYMIALAVFGFCLMLVFSYFVFRSRQRQKAAKELVTLQNEEIQQQNEEIQQALAVVHEQKSLIEQKNENITASITYALRIQNAIIPKEPELQKHFDCFVFFRPRDIVSGDFYWFAEKGVSGQSSVISKKTPLSTTDHASLPPDHLPLTTKKYILAVADCTGHGVSGAFMTMIGNNILNQIVHDYEIHEPDQILNLMPALLEKTLLHAEGTVKDGMDIAIITIAQNPQGFENLAGFEVGYAGAMNPLYYVENQEFKEIKADKIPIGNVKDENFSYQKHEVLSDQWQVASNSTLTTDHLTLYLCSDGFQDQFGGEKNKKFMVKKFKNLLFEISEKPMSEQKQILEQTFDTWKGTSEQTDDVLVVGLRV